MKLNTKTSVCSVLRTLQMYLKVYLSFFLKKIDRFVFYPNALDLRSLALASCTTSLFM